MTAARWVERSVPEVGSSIAACEEGSGHAARVQFKEMITK
jgi:hypothetical protein